MTKINNINELYQLRKSIRNNNNTLLVGFDVSKEFSDLCLTDSAQNILLKKYKFAHTKEGFTKMLNKVYSIKDKFNKQDIFCGLEPTGKYHKPLASFLLNKDLALGLISTVVSSDNRRSLDGSWRKNDSKDAFNITDLMSRNRFLFYPSPDIFYDGLRDLVNHRYKLSKLLRGTKTMIKNSFFSEFFPEIEKIYSNILHPEILHILNEFPTAYHIREISLKKFIRNFYKSKKITNRAIQRLQTEQYKDYKLSGKSLKILLGANPIFQYLFWQKA